VVAHVLARSSESESCKFYFDVVPDVIRTVMMLCDQ
jgi:hypothetical protein